MSMTSSPAQCTRHVNRTLATLHHFQQISRATVGVQQHHLIFFNSIFSIFSGLALLKTQKHRIRQRNSTSFPFVTGSDSCGGAKRCPQTEQRRESSTIINEAQCSKEWNEMVESQMEQVAEEGTLTAQKARSRSKSGLNRAPVKEK